MSHYPISENEIKTAQMQLDASIKTLEAEKQVLESLARIVPEYGNKVYNKRFETFVNERLAKEFGTTPIDNPYKDEPKEYANVRIWLHVEKYIETKHTRIGYHFPGFDIHTDYDSKQDENNRHRRYIGERATSETLYNSDTLDELKASITARIGYIDKSIKTATENRENLTALALKHNELVEAINAHNDGISYIIADSFRIR